LIKYLPSEFKAEGISDETRRNPTKKSEDSYKRTSFNIQSSIEETIENGKNETKVENKDRVYKIKECLGGRKNRRGEVKQNKSSEK
jgi:hypothetical protein